MPHMSFGGGDKLKAADLPENTNIPVTISAATFEELGMDGKSDQKWVLRFHGKEKCLPLNATNGEALAHAFGYESEGWINKQIELYRTTTPFQGKVVPCIRVRPITGPAPVAAAAAPLPAAVVDQIVAPTQAAAAPAADDDNIPF